MSIERIEDGEDDFSRWDDASASDLLNKNFKRLRKTPLVDENKFSQEWKSMKKTKVESLESGHGAMPFPTPMPEIVMRKQQYVGSNSNSNNSSNNSNTNGLNPMYDKPYYDLTDEDDQNVHELVMVNRLDKSGREDDRMAGFQSHTNAVDGMNGTNTSTSTITSANGSFHSKSITGSNANFKRVMDGYMDPIDGSSNKTQSHLGEDMFECVFCGKYEQLTRIDRHENGVCKFVNDYDSIGSKTPSTSNGNANATRDYNGFASPNEMDLSGSTANDLSMVLGMHLMNKSSNTNTNTNTNTNITHMDPMK